MPYNLEHGKRLTKSSMMRAHNGHTSYTPRVWSAIMKCAYAYARQSRKRLITFSVTHTGHDPANNAWTGPHAVPKLWGVRTPYVQQSRKHLLTYTVVRAVIITYTPHTQMLHSTHCHSTTICSFRLKLLNKTINFGSDNLVRFENLVD